MHILLIQLDLHIPHAQSLKEKRREIKSLKDKLASRFNASVSEVGKLDSWQHSVMAICMVSSDRSYLDKQYSNVESLVLEYSNLELLAITREWL